MNYTLKQLQVFLKVVQTESVTKASEELYMTQPAVSIQLKNFQDQFEIPLTEVVGRKLYITEFGREIAQAAEQIFNQVHAINYKTLAFKGQLTGRLKLSVVSTGKYVMPYFLSDFVKEHPGIELMMDVTNKLRVVEHLEQNEVDFALVSIIPPHLQIERLDLIPNKLFLIGNSDRKLVGKQSMPEVLKSGPFIFREKGSGTRQTMEAFVEKKRLSVLKKMELTSNEAVKQALLADMGFSVMPVIGIRNELMNGALSIIPVDGLPITTTWSLIWLKGKKHSVVANSFLEYLNQHKEEVVRKRFNWIEQF